MIPNIRTNHCPHCKAQAKTIEALQADNAKMREDLQFYAAWGVTSPAHDAQSTQCQTVCDGANVGT